jgi:hypothetical protein
MGLNRGMLRLAGAMIPRTQPRVADQRCEPRHEDLTDRAILSFRGQIISSPCSTSRKAG